MWKIGEPTQLCVHVPTLNHGVTSEGWDFPSRKKVHLKCIGIRSLLIYQLHLSNDSDQIKTFHQPRFPWNKGSHFPSYSLPFGGPGRVKSQDGVYLCCYQSHILRIRIVSVCDGGVSSTIPKFDAVYNTVIPKKTISHEQTASYQFHIDFDKSSRFSSLTFSQSAPPSGRSRWYKEVLQKSILLGYRFHLGIKVGDWFKVMKWSIDWFNE